MFMWKHSTCYPEMWPTGKWFLQNDNVWPHTALSAKEFLSVHQTTLLPQVPYSPDSSFRDFFLIPITEMSTDRTSQCWHSGHVDSRNKPAPHHSQKCFPELLQRPPETLKEVDQCRGKPFQRRSLTSEYTYTILTFILSHSDLARHRLYLCIRFFLCDLMTISITKII
jgi:hypothetical protein